MKISTKGRYAVRAMLDLALQEENSPVLLKDIARRQEISERYLEHMMYALKNAGLLRSTRGARGGFALGRDPGDITLLEILRVSMGDCCIVDCIRNPATCSRSPRCAMRDVWDEVGEAIEGVLGALTLQELADRQRAKETRDHVMYYI